ncbi:broad-complex core protein isoform X3 [Musca autumnalis]|uniref:broad-complex core protein isoform X3 n=1 Tax=Musca autumnalis TaxID=221902 RepID=UPI003CE79252
MDETQHFCLRWNNYQSSITSAFENLRDDEDFVDVTLACEGRSIKAHRVVLSACSPYFRDLLKSTPCKHPVILLQDVNFNDLHSLVEFIYHGEVNVHQKSLQSFLKTAEVLRVSGLTQQQAEETHSQLAQIQNLANSGVRTPLNPLHTSMSEDSPLYQRNAVSPPPPLPPTQMPFFKRIGMLRREHNTSTSSAEDPTNTLKRMRGPDNGLPPSNTNSPDIVHPRSTSPQLTPTDFSTMKHNNNNSPPPKDEKRNGSSTNTPGNGGSGSNSSANGNGITTGEKGESLAPSPLTRRAEDVKSEPMELVCSNNNDEHSNDSNGENEQLRVGSVDCGKGSLSSGNDEEIENTMPPHQPSAPFLISPAESKLFPSASFTFPMGNLDPAAFASLNSQMPSAADIAASPQGSHNAMRSTASSPTSSTSAPPSPPTAITSPNSSLGSMVGHVNNGGVPFNLHASPPRPGSGGAAGTAPANNNNNTPQMPLRMPPPTSGGINEPQECPYCRRTFSCYYSLKRHFQDKHEQSDTLYVCEFCSRRYRTKNSLTTHKSLQHRGSSGMLKRLLKTSMKNVLVPPPHHHHHHHPHHPHAISHQRTPLFDFSSELGQPPPGIQ